MSLAEFAMSRPERWCPHDPHPKQAEFLALEDREALYGGAAGGGKSDALLMGALEHVDVPGYAAILFRRTHRDLALPGALMDRAHGWLGQTAAKWSELDKTWTFPSGATVSFGYLDGPQDHHRYQSAEFQYVGFDELSQFHERQYTYLFSRLRRLKGVGLPIRMRAATNPGGIGHEWIQSRWGIPEEIDFSAIYEHDGRTFLPARLDDNPSIDQDEYDETLRKLDGITYQQLRHGRWVRDPSGLVYSGFDPRRNCLAVVPALPAGEAWTYVLAADFGVTDPTAFAVWAFTEHDPVAYLMESEQWPGLSPSEAADIYRLWEQRYGGFERTIGDLGGLGKAFAEEWHRRYHIHVRPARKNDKLGFIKLFNGECERDLIQVVEAKNVDYIRDVMALPWKDDTHQKESPDMPNHLPDAALYGWRECRSWQVTDRPRPPRGLDAWAADAKKRKQRIIERAQKQAQEDEYHQSVQEWSDGAWTD